MLTNSRLEGKRRDARRKELEKLLKEIKGEKTRQKEVDAPSPAPELPGVNTQFPNFSDAVRIRYEEGRGRFAVAARDISAGELLARETPYVQLLERDLTRSHCWHCLLCTKSPLPCATCSGVQYCSRRCRQAAATYHKYECLHTDVLYQAGMGAWHLAYRALTLLPIEHYRERREEFLERRERAGAGGEGEVFRSEDPASFHSLVTHDGVGKKEAAALMMQCHVVVFLLRMLRVTGYLEEEEREGALGEEELLLARLLHHFMRAAYYNTHEISEVEKTGDGWLDNKPRRVGRVTNPTLALINHSCDPNYLRVSHGVTTYGFAARSIPKGQEILDTYCKPYTASPLEARQKYLEKYLFSCLCPACKSNWPVMAGLPSQLTGLPPAAYRQGS